ncbi:hypothetical protein [Luteolibacter luteus]|uniref:Uncharacterized protein n=1 Tax=Luteolibacter luteus TaxID=2728835 RepID=A0A858RIK3_9BACT|nr:hypothetical protein [Luteolibacter luteus]QJE97046.1 hypothetical protein HHL09_15045 [Luteolibacter luteus]
MNKAVLLATHALALGAGWLVLWDGGLSPGIGHADGGVTTKVERDRKADLEEGKLLLREMRIGWETQKKYEAEPQDPAERDFGEVRREDAERRAKKLEEIRKLSLSIVLPNDPVEGLKTIGGDEIELGAYFAAWLRVDPETAMSMISSDERYYNYEVPGLALEIWVGEKGPLEVGALMKDFPKLQSPVAGAAMRIAGRENLESLNDLLESLKGVTSRDFLIGEAFRGLPEEKRQAAVAFAQGQLPSNEAADAIINMATGIFDAKEAREFLKEVIAGDLDPEVRRQMERFGNFREILGGGVDRDSPMADRIEAAMIGDQQGGPDEQKRARALEKIMSEDVGVWMKASSLQQGLLSGEKDLVGLWSQTKVQFPQYQEGEDRQKLLAAVLGSAGVLDPKGAMEVLKKEAVKGTIADQVAKIVWTKIYPDVQASIELAGLIPEDELRPHIERYDSMYEAQLPQKIEHYGDFWKEWLKSQPQSLNLDLVLYQTAKRFAADGNQEGAREMQALIRDPEVKARPVP